MFPENNPAYMNIIMSLLGGGQGGFGNMFSTPFWALQQMSNGASFPQGGSQPLVGGSVGGSVGGTTMTDPGSVATNRSASPAMQALIAAQSGASSAPTNPQGPQSPPPQPPSNAPSNPNPMSQMNLNAPAPQGASDPYATSQLPPQPIGGNAYAG